MKKIWKIMIIPLFVLGFFAIFWGIWYFLADKFPSISSINLIKKDVVFNLPFQLARYWDAPLTLIWLISLILVFSSKEIKNSDDLPIIIFAGFIFGLIFGFFLSFAGLAYSLGVGSLFSVIFGLCRLRFKKALAFILIFSLFIGWDFAIIFALIFLSVYAIGVILNILLSLLPWDKILIKTFEGLEWLLSWNNGKKAEIS